MGLLTLAAVRALQPAADVYCLARYGFQAEHAERLGARGVIYDNDHAYREIARITGARYLEGYFKNRILLGGFDAIFDTVGSDRSIHNSLRWARGGGTLVVLGINFMPGKIDYTPVWEQEVKVTGINCHAMEPAGESSFEAAARLLEEKRVSVDGLITHRLPLGRYREAIELFLSKGRSKAIKIVLEHR
jgi:threonine dehydrogenase-like Zn-dependent dehydrogenase